MRVGRAGAAKAPGRWADTGGGGGRAGDGIALSELEVRAIRKDEVGAVEDLIADAFKANPVTRALFGPGVPTRTQMRRLNAVALRNRHVKTVVAVRDGELTGVMKTADTPHCEPSGIEGLRFLWDAALALRWRIFPAAAVFRNIGRSHPAWAHRHLVVLGVAPEHQRSGIGTRLLEAFVEQADCDGVSAFLETDTEAARDLYERFGFRVVKTEPIPTGRFYMMWRASLVAR